jgi:hypothetical protein
MAVDWSQLELLQEECYSQRLDLVQLDMVHISTRLVAVEDGPLANSNSIHRNGGDGSA